MNEEAINELIMRGDRAALLLGEITGSLSILVTKADCNMHDIKNLFSLLTNRVNSIYYESK